MTREEAIAYGNDYYIDLISACCKIDEKHKEFVKMSIKALEQEPCKPCIYYCEDGYCRHSVNPEQEPIINKIRAEMLEEMLSHSGTGEEVIQAYVDGLKKGLDILDKYKAESEET